jgi:hypothetical protein
MVKGIIVKKTIIRFAAYMGAALLFSLVFVSCKDSFDEAMKKEAGYNEAPVPANSGAISISLIPGKAVIRWERALDDLTTQGSLLYLVYRSAAEPAGSAASVARLDALQSATALTTGWTENLSTVTVSLTRGKTFWINVFVKDLDGNVAAYSPSSVTMPENEAPVPGDNGALSVQINSGVKNLYWIEAADDLTAQKNLHYRVFYSASRSDVLSYPSAGTEITSGWTREISNVALAQAGDLWFNVFVIDVNASDGLVSAYEPILVSFSAAVPVPGGSGTITADAFAAKKMNLSWSLASGSAPLTYIVYYARTQAKVFTYDAATGSATAYGEWTADLAAVTVSGLEKNIVYWFNVFVRDSYGQIVPYTPVSKRTMNQ